MGREGSSQFRVSRHGYWDSPHRIMALVMFEWVREERLAA